MSGKRDFWNRENNIKLMLFTRDTPKTYKGQCKVGLKDGKRDTGKALTKRKLVVILTLEKIDFKEKHSWGAESFSISRCVADFPSPGQPLGALSAAWSRAGGLASCYLHHPKHETITWRENCLLTFSSIFIGFIWHCCFKRCFLSFFLLVVFLVRVTVLYLLERLSPLQVV